MTEYPCKIVTIVTEAILEQEICALLKQLGASGYTVTDARGAGSRGIRSAGWQSSSNVRIEVICNTEVAQKISLEVQDRYYENYAMVLFNADVTVLRPNKFG